MLKFATDEIFRSTKVLKADKVNHDTYHLSLGLPEGYELGIVPGSYVMIKGKLYEGKVPGKWNGVDDECAAEPAVRPYDPILCGLGVTTIELIIKPKLPNENFIDGGRVSRYISELKVGDEVSVKGGPPKKTYQEGRFYIQDGTQVDGKKNFGFVGAGSGITPLLQLARYMLSEESKHRPDKLTILFLNKTEQDIICKEFLDDLIKAGDGIVSVHYAIENLPTDGKWDGAAGRISSQMIKDYLPAPSADTFIVYCGPSRFRAATKSLLVENGFASDMITEG